MWEHHWRSITVNANGTDYSVRVDTTLGALLDEHAMFDRKPGALLAIDGSVIDKHGGKPVSVQVNGRDVDKADRADTALPERATVTVSDGEDVTEEHTVEQRPIAHGASIATVGGSIQIKRSDGKDGVREVWVGRKSGKEVEKDVLEQPTDLLVESISPRPAGRKVIALTFDDGPSKYSAPILDILRDKGVKATFFDLGQQAASYPAAEQRMKAEGHQVASHSNSHPNMPTLSRDELRADITAGFDNIKAASGVETRTMRAPYGAFGEQQWKDAGDLIDMNVLWDIDTLDWKLPGAQAIHDTVLSNAHNGAIVLMHDGGGDRSQDVEALPGIIDDLKKQGYQFVTIDQLLAM